MEWFLTVSVIVLVLAFSYACYWIAFYNPESRHKEAVVVGAGERNAREEALNARMEGMPYERVYIRARDGLLLSGRYYHVQDQAPLHIQFHGYRGSGVRDFSAGNAVARQIGCNTLVVDQRAHGLSQGNTMTFGVKERHDCLCWAEFALDRFGPDTPVFLSGVSMGAATVLMASELDLPENVVGIIGDCPYSSPGAIIRKICRDVRIPGYLAYPFVVLGALVYGRFCLWGSSPVRAVRHARVPVLLIHGSEDKYVPPEMSASIFEACASERYLEIFPGASHGGSCLTDTSRYEKILRTFTDLCLGKSGFQKSDQ